MQIKNTLLYTFKWAAMTTDEQEPEMLDSGDRDLGAGGSPVVKSSMNQKSQQET